MKLKAQKMQKGRVYEREEGAGKNAQDEDARHGRVLDELVAQGDLRERVPGPRGVHVHYFHDPEVII